MNKGDDSKFRVANPGPFFCQEVKFASIFSLKSVAIDLFPQNVLAKVMERYLHFFDN